MIRLFCSVLFLLLPGASLLTQMESGQNSDYTLNATNLHVVPAWQSMYETMHLDSLISQDAFHQAFVGYYKISDRKKEILTVIDFSKASTEKRLAVIDMQARKLLYSSVVAHGRNSGGNYATSFSNQNGSNKSSLGFYLTNETYQGSNGYSLRLDGLEKGVNDNARQRAIVMHGAAYAHPSTARSGRLGRSFGCPAIPPSLTRPIINTIKGGSVMFIYAPEENYLAQSSILNDIENGNTLGTQSL